jgi:hypothetical protein
MQVILQGVHHLTLLGFICESDAARGSLGGNLDGEMGGWAADWGLWSRGGMTGGGADDVLAVLERGGG